MWRDCDALSVVRRALVGLPAAARDRAGRPTRGGFGARTLPVALIVFATFVGACSSSNGGFQVAPVSMRSSSSGPAQAVDGREALMAAIDATRADYRYQTTVTVDDAVTLRAEGSVAAGTRRATITSDGHVLEYLQTGYGRWVMGPTDRWEISRDDLEQPVPLDALADPSAVGVDRAVGGAVVVDATYSGEALGVPGVREVEVEVAISDGVVRHVRYEVPAGERTAEVVTVISDVGEVGAITTPDVAGGNPTTR